MTFWQSKCVIVTGGFLGRRAVERLRTGTGVPAGGRSAAGHPGATSVAGPLTASRYMVRK